MWGNSSHIFCGKNPQYICGANVFMPKNCVCTKNHLHIQFTQLLSLQVHKNNGRSINQPCTSVPCSMGQAGCHYKDSNYKEAKWKETVEILHLTNEDVIKKWKSLRDTYVRHKNIKSKSRDGLSQCKPKWKYYNIMSFMDITLLK